MKRSALTSVSINVPTNNNEKPTVYDKQALSGLTGNDELTCTHSFSHPFSSRKGRSAAALGDCEMPHGFSNLT